MNFEISEQTHQPQIEKPRNVVPIADLLVAKDVNNLLEKPPAFEFPKKLKFVRSNGEIRVTDKVDTIRHWQMLCNQEIDMENLDFVDAGFIVKKI
jgi:hypothetical protein